MPADFSYDPVTAVDEKSATGATADIFADIRDVMGIPLVTSIWRGLAGMDDSLAQAWRATRPIYLHGEPDRALARIVEQAELPRPEALAPTQLTCAGISKEDLSHIRTIIHAYNRSNGMNLVALSALIAPAAPKSGIPSAMVAPRWPEFPQLLAREALSDDTWDLIRHVNAFGAPSLDANVATLWRHLGHWPSLLSLIHAGLAPLQARGEVELATSRMVEATQAEAVTLAAWRELDAPLIDVIGAGAMTTVTGYVTTKTQVVRMVTLGHILARWLA